MKTMVLALRIEISREDVQFVVKKWMQAANALKELSAGERLVGSKEVADALGMLRKDVTCLLRHARAYGYAELVGCNGDWKWRSVEPKAQGGALNEPVPSHSENARRSSESVDRRSEPRAGARQRVLAAAGH
jgi:hypothetical protein